MRKIFTLRSLCTILLMTAAITQGGAQTIAWNFSAGTASPSTTVAGVTAADLVQGNNNGTTPFITTTSASTGYTGVSGTFNAGAAARTGALNTAASGSAYVEFTLTPDNGKIVTLTAVTFGMRSTSTGPVIYTLRSNVVNNFGTDIITGSLVANSAWTLKNNNGFSVSSTAGTPVTFRIYGFGGTGSAGASTANWRLDDIALTVSVTNAANVNLSNLFLSAGSLVPVFDPQTINYSISVDNSVSATTVTPTAADPTGSITVNGTAVGSGSTSPSIPLATGSNTIATIVTSADHTTSKTYNVTINRAALVTQPTLVATVPLPDFGNVCLGSSPINSFTLSGTSLDGSPVTVTSLAGFAYSLSATGPFTPTLSIPYTGGGFSGKQVFVQFSPSAIQSYNGNIALTGGGVAAYNVPATGAGINTVASVTTGSSSNISSGGATVAGTITASGCGTVTDAGVEYSTTSGFANGSGTSISASSFAGGSFSVAITGLQPNTTYFYKAYATTGAGTSEGTQLSFTTGAVPVVMSLQQGLVYSEGFDDVANWANGFAGGIGATHFAPAPISTAGTIPDGVKITTSTASFSSGTSGGVQKGSGNLVFLSTGSPDNTTSTAVDLLLDFTGVNAGTISFDWASINNSTGDRAGSLRVYASTNGSSFTELTGAAVLNVINNVSTSGSVTNVNLPPSFSNSATARLRFYYHNGSGGATGSRPKISIDNLVVTAVSTTPCATPSAAPTNLVFGTLTDSTIQGSFTPATPAANEYMVVISANNSLTSMPQDGQVYNVGDNVGDGSVVSRGFGTSFLATGLSGATTYNFFVFSINSVCVGGPKYLTTTVLNDDETTPAGLPPCAAPADQATQLVITEANTNVIRGTFTAGTGSEYLVLKTNGVPPTTLPATGQVYNDGDVLGNATVLQRSGSTDFTAAGLTPNTAYSFYVYSLNAQACVNGPVYNTTAPLNITQSTSPLPVCSTPSAQPSNLSFNASNNTVSGAFNAVGDSYNYLVIRSSSPTLGAVPADNTDYNPGDVFGSGVVVSTDAANSFSAAGLNPSTTYYFFVFTANKNCTGGTKYLAVSPLTGSVTTTNAPVNHIYFGNLHSHSDYSDGNQDHPGFTPTDDYTFALGSQGMDFLGISEHNHFSSVNNPGTYVSLYHKGTAEANAFNATHTGFLALYGMEWGVISGGGHVVVYGDGMDSLFGWESDIGGVPGPNYDVFVPKSVYTGSTGLFKVINDHASFNTFATLAHPNSTDYNNIANIDYDSTADQAITGCAVESGPATSTNTSYSNPASPMFYLWYFQKLLSKGYHLGPTIDHDNHNTTFGRTTHARTAVLAPALTRTEIVNAMRNMHFYATEDIDAHVDFTINTRIMGSVFTDRNAPSISVTLTDPTTPTSNAVIRIMFGIPGSGITAVKIDSVIGNTLNFVDVNLPNNATGYYYADITDGGARIITSPIWYTRTCATTGDTTASACGSFSWAGTTYSTSGNYTHSFTTTGGCDSTVTLHLTINQPATGDTTAVACDSFTWYGNTYTATGTATQVLHTSAGCDSTVTLHLTIHNSPTTAAVQPVAGTSGCPGGTVALTASGSSDVSAYQWYKDGSPINSATNASFGAVASGAYSVTVSNADNCSLASAPVNVTIEDHTAPVPDQANLPVISGECAATVTAVPTATDNCAGSITATTTDPLTYTGQGTYTIHWTYNDGNGNTTTQLQTVTIQDITAPVPDQANLAVISGECSATVTVVPTATDNCAGALTATTTDPLSYTGQGTYTIHWTFNDGNGNTTVQLQTVIIKDVTAPTLTGVPAGITVSCDGVPAAATVTASDNCDPSPTVSMTETSTQDPNTSAAAHYNYTITRTWIAADASGNTRFQSQTIYVKNTQAPSLNAPSNISVGTDPGQCGAVANFVATATGACGSPVTISYSQQPGSSFATGVTTVAITATDVSGNTATTSFTITVTDNEKPVIVPPIDRSAPADAGKCGATVNPGVAAATDNCGAGTPVGTRSDGQPLNALYPTGTTTITWTVTDIHGNTNTAIQKILVTDTQNPTITPPANISVAANAAGCSATGVVLGTPATADNCAVASVSNNAPASFPYGATVVTWTATDASGNKATATQTVTVTDTQKPVITCPAPVTTCVNATGSYSVPALTATDNCGIATITYQCSGATTRSGTGNNASGTFSPGTTTITWTVTDIHGNISTCTSSVKVSAVPVVNISVNGAGSFCNSITLTASSSTGAGNFQWSNGATSSSITLNAANADGAYSVNVTDANGCSSAVPASYTYSKQSLLNSYTVLGLKSVLLGVSNNVQSGSVGVVNNPDNWFDILDGEATILNGSSVAGTGAFVKAPAIYTLNPVNIPNKIFGTADVTLPVMQFNTVTKQVLNALPSYSVNKNVTVTLSGNYNQLTVNQGATATLGGNTYGTVVVNQGAKVKFTSATVSIADLVINDGQSTSKYTDVSFAASSVVKVSDVVNIGAFCRINPDGANNTVFYMGDLKPDVEKFIVKGEGSSVSASVYMPNGILWVLGCSQTDIHMTGMFIAQRIVADSRGVIWNSASCTAAGGGPAVTGTTDPIIVTDKIEFTQPAQTLQVTVLPNPSTADFGLKISSSSDATVFVRVMDASGRLVDGTSGGAGSILRVGGKLSSGMYYAQVVQAGQQVTVKLMKTK